MADCPSAFYGFNSALRTVSLSFLSAGTSQQLVVVCSTVGSGLPHHELFRAVFVRDCINTIIWHAYFGEVSKGLYNYYGARRRFHFHWMSTRFSCILLHWESKTRSCNCVIVSWRVWTLGSNGFFSCFNSCYTQRMFCVLWIHLRIYYILVSRITSQIRLCAHNWSASYHYGFSPVRFWKKISVVKFINSNSGQSIAVYSPCLSA